MKTVALLGFALCSTGLSVFARTVAPSTAPKPAAEIVSAGYMDGQAVMPDLTASLPPASAASLVASISTR